MFLQNHYRLRSFEPGNMADVERINLMYYHPEVMKAKGYFGKGLELESDKDLHFVDSKMFKCKSEINLDNHDISLAVTDLDSSVLGWVWFYRDKRHPLPKGAQKILGINELSSTIYQVSYEKLLSTGWPTRLLRATKHVTREFLNTERKGVIVEGLRLAIIKLGTEHRIMHDNQKKLVLYAFVSLENIASQKVLEKNEFVKIERKYMYDGENQFLWVKVV